MQEEVSDFTDALCQNKCDSFRVTLSYIFTLGYTEV